MLNHSDIMSTVDMIDHQHLDIRTITMGISLLSCCDPDAGRACNKIYEKITRYAEKLVKTGEDIQREFGIPIVNKRISVTPMALVAGASETEDYVPFAMALDRAAKTCGVNFIGGYSALVQKGMTRADEKLIRSIPEALDRTELVCSSINVGSTRAGINMDAVALMGKIVKETAARTADRDGLGCAKLVIFCNAVEDNPFMAGAFHGVGEAEKVINDAKAYQNAQLPQAQAQADQLIQNAEYLKQKRINEAIEKVAMFEAMYSEYAQNPAITRTRMYYEAISQVLPGVKLYINTGGQGGDVQMLLPLESLAGTEGGNAK